MKYFQASVLVLLLLLAPAARALSFQFSGVWTGSTTPPFVPLALPAATTFTGSFSYDPSLVGTAGPAGTTYLFGDMSVDVFSNGAEVVNFSAAINVANDNEILLPGVNDVFQIGLILPDGIPQAASLSSLLGVTVLGFQLDLVDQEEDAISSEALPTAAELLSFNASLRNLGIRYRLQAGDEVLQLGQVLRISAIPNPSSISLLLIALAGVGFSARRRRSCATKARNS